MPARFSAANTKKPRILGDPSLREQAQRLPTLPPPRPMQAVAQDGDRVLGLPALSLGKAGLHRHSRGPEAEEPGGPLPQP